MRARSYVVGSLFVTLALAGYACGGAGGTGGTGATGTGAGTGTGAQGQPD